MSIRGLVEWLFGGVTGIEVTTDDIVIKRRFEEDLVIAIDSLTAIPELSNKALHVISEDTTFSENIPAFSPLRKLDNFPEQEALIEHFNKIEQLTAID